MAMTYLTKLKPEPMGAYSLSTAYGVNSLVMSGDGAAAYISVKDVPAGTPLTNTEYWKKHTDLTAVKQSAEAAAQKANAARDEMLEIARNLTDIVEKSGNPVQAELVGGLPFDRVETMLEPIQSGSGDPSPSNIRPISGWTGANLNHTNDSGFEHTYSADFGQTVYGGTLDWQTGVLTVDKAFVEYDGSADENWLTQTTATSGYRRFLIVPGDAEPNTGAGNVAYVVSNMYKATSPNGTYSKTTGICVNQNELMIYDADRATLTVDEWKAWLSEHPVQIAYKLATPITIQLTPQEIKQIQGVNTLYGDGSISMTGRADKALELEARIAALEAAG